MFALIAFVALSAPVSSWSGELTLHFHDAALEYDQQDKYRVTYKVTGRDGATLTADRKSLLLETRLGSTIIPPLKNQEPLITKAWLSPRGSLLDLDPFDGGVFQLDRLWNQWRPAGSDAWRVKLTTNGDHYAPKAEATFAKAGADYTFDYREVPAIGGMKATGHFTFDSRTGRPLKAIIEATKAPIPGGSEAATLTLTYEAKN